MARLSPGQIAGFAQAAGFSAVELPIAVAVALAESGGDPAATNTTGNSAGTDLGLWQINDHYHPWIRQQQWQDPLVNAKAAKRVWDEAGGKWKPWSTYKSDTLNRYIVQGYQGAQNIVKPDGSESSFLGDIKDGLVGAVPGAEGVAEVAKLGAAGAKWVSNPRNWLRVAYVVGGGAVVLVGLSYVGATSRPAQAIIGSVKGAAVKTVTKGKA